MAITACHYTQVFDMLKEAASRLIVIAVLPLIANDPTILCILNCRGMWGQLKCRCMPRPFLPVQRVWYMRLRFTMSMCICHVIVCYDAHILTDWSWRQLLPWLRKPSDSLLFLKERAKCCLNSCWIENNAARYAQDSNYISPSFEWSLSCTSSPAYDTTHSLN